MKKEALIQKWLDNNLNTEEQKAFEQLDDYGQLVKLDSALSHFKAPEFSLDKNYQTTKSKLQANTSHNWLKPLLRFAAVLAIGFSVFYYTSTLDTEVNTNIAEHTIITLPDQSEVNLNANSHLTFNDKEWSKNRKLELEGEAFFKVEKGQKFDVITNHGTITVLGTQFNVKQRNRYFEVTCYEGLVGVTHQNKTVKLKPGETFKVIDGKQIATKKEYAAEPSWINGESHFKSVPFKYVITELENQYDFSVNSKDIDTSRIFTGSFTHNNLDLALKSITLPLNLSYIKSGKSIILKRE